MHEVSAGQDQLFVTYVSDDSGGGMPAEWFVQEVVQSGGQYATQLAAVVLYRRR